MLRWLARKARGQESTDRGYRAGRKARGQKSTDRGYLPDTIGYRIHH
jgi:hypothetical protein